MMTFEEFIQELKKTLRDWIIGRIRTNDINRNGYQCAGIAVFGSKTHENLGNTTTRKVFTNNDSIPPYSDLEACYIRERLLRATGLCERPLTQNPRRPMTSPRKTLLSLSSTPSKPGNSPPRGWR